VSGACPVLVRADLLQRKNAILMVKEGSRIVGAVIAAKTSAVVDSRTPQAE
jgi:hypothetical protein